MLRYIGKGRAMIGIPARDLIDEEVEKYGGEEELLKTGLYEVIKTDMSGAILYDEAMELIKNRKSQDDGNKAVKRNYENKSKGGK